MGAGAGLSAIAYAQGRRALEPRSADSVLGFRRPPANLGDQTFALARYAPSLSDPNATSGPLIANTFVERHRGRGYVRKGELGNATFASTEGNRVVIPWAPLFPRDQELWRPPSFIARKLGGADLLVWNDSSHEQPLFGNKARKYEFLLPNLQWSGARRTATLGAVSSNHVLQFALANRLADLTGQDQPLNSDLDLVLFDVPGTRADEERLGLLQQLSQRVVVTSNKFGLAGEVAYELAAQQMRSQFNAIVPPGGSNELSALGHMNAVADFAQALEAVQAWDAPPDLIFVAMGSGSTVLGLLLGVHIMGWNTRIVGVSDQDQPYVSRLVANQQPLTPFVEGNVARLAGKTLDWLKSIDFPGLPASVQELLRPEAFQPDSSSWAPGYGLINASDEAWRDDLAAAGVKLDPVFTLKAWRSLTAMADAGALKNKRILFWNTYNAFDYAGNASPVAREPGDGHATL